MMDVLHHTLCNQSVSIPYYTRLSLASPTNNTEDAMGFTVTPAAVPASESPTTQRPTEVTDATKEPTDAPKVATTEALTTPPTTVAQTEAPTTPSPPVTQGNKDTNERGGDKGVGIRERG